MDEQLAELQAALGNERYTIEREVGRGGMATVYLAHDVKHSRRVALKVLHPELADTLGAERFAREIRITAGLSHPHILPLLDSGASQGALYYTMPFVDGESLRARLDRETQLPVDEALTIAREVAAALAHAHVQGIVHRDIKPENILLDGSGAVVADFGIAQALDAAGGERLTQTGFAIGTPAYMSPEQATGRERVDGRTDIYALGCLLYETLAGAPPFTGSTAQAILARHLVDPVPPLRTVRTTVPEFVEQAVMKALAKVPADRFATAAKFGEALDDRGVPAAVLRPKRRRAMIAAAVLPALVAVAVGAIQRLRSRTPVAAEASLIAVLPFTPAVPDSALTRLGRDLVVTVGATLDRVGELRTVDRFNILAAAGAGTPLPLDQGAAVARRFGAGTFVLGSLTREGPNARLDVGAYRADDHSPVGATIVVKAPPESLGALTDSLVWAVLRRVWQRGEPPTPSLASVSTASVAAMRAFLEGERALVDNEWGDAQQSYGEAIAADSTFVLATYRYAETQAWLEQELPRAVLDRLRRHRDALADRDRLLADAFLAFSSDSAGAAMRLLEQATQRYPDYWPAWFVYADKLVHFAGMIGHTRADARTALRRVLQLNPRMVPAWHHLELVGPSDTAAYRDAVEHLVALGWFATPRERPWRLHAWNELLYRLGLSRGALDRATIPLLDSVARHSAALGPGPYSQDVTPEFLLLYGFPTAQIELNRRVLALRVTPAVAAANLRGIALSWAARGAWDSALVAMDRYAAAEPDRSGAWDAYELAVLGAWLEAVPPVEATRRRQAAYRTLEQLGSRAIGQRRAELGWLDGILAYRTGDNGALAAARQALRRSEAPQAFVAFHDSALAAFEAALGGDPQSAARALAALERQCAWSSSCGSYGLAVHNFAAARWLLQAGDSAQAVHLLVWHECLQNGRYFEATEVLTGLAYLELARIEAARGAVDQARESYRQFLQRYDMPMPSQRHLVEEVKRALASLPTP